MPEFNLGWVLRKSERGMQAIKARDPALSVRGRSLLIMVNGDKTGHDLVRAMPAPEESARLLADLVAAGFAEAVVGGLQATGSTAGPAPSPAAAASAPMAPAPAAAAVAVATPVQQSVPASAPGMVAPRPAATPVPPPAAASTAMPPRDLKAAIQRASRLLYDMLGPTAEPLCMRLEGCRTGDEFMARLQDCRTVVARARSEQRAQEFYAAATA